MPWFMGIDIGSVISKGVITENTSLLTYCMIPSGVDYKVTSQKLKEQLLAKSGLGEEKIDYVIATGCGASNVKFANELIEGIISCARGMNSVFPSSRTVIDVGGQASRVIKIDPQGRVSNFAISEKCAAGSGRFLQIIANVLRIKLEEVGPLSLKSKKPVSFTTGCAVFGETEAITRVSEGVAKEDILAGVHEALANKISALISTVGLEEPCAIGGATALDIGLIKSIEEKLKLKLLVPPQPQIITALGAAIEAARRVGFKEAS